MSTQNKSSAERIFGRWEHEAGGTVIFISEQGRRIRFRYVGPSLQRPGAAGYQCTECPVTALMIDAEFRIADPCAGHECSVGACHPQWTPSAHDATTAVNAQKSPATTTQASCHLKPAKKVIAEAVYDANGSILWPSERYKGTSFKFRPNKSKPGSLRRHFYCSACVSKCHTYECCLAACGISRRHLIVLDGTIIDHHPDDVGTNRGHLCQQPDLEEKLKAMKVEKTSAQGTPNVAEIAAIDNGGAKSVPKIKVVYGPSAKMGSARGRSLAKRMSTLREERGEPSSKRIRSAMHGLLNECTGCMYTKSVNGPGADKRIHSDLDSGTLSRRMDSAVDQEDSEQAIVTSNDGSSRQCDAVDALEEPLQYPESTYDVSSAAQSDTGSRSDGPHGWKANASSTQPVVKKEQELHHSAAPRLVANADESNIPTPMTRQTNGTIRVSGCAASSEPRKRSVGSPVELKPPTTKSPDVVTIEDSDDDSDANVVSSASSRASRKPAEREPDENNDSEQHQHDPAGKFHRFLRESGLLTEWLSYSFTDSGEPMAYLQQPHVTERWIRFNQRK